MLKVYLFILREKESTIRGRAERHGERERILSRLHTVSAEPNMGLELTNREIMTWAEVGRSTDWAIQAPLIFPFKQNMSVLASVCMHVHVRPWKWGQRGAATWGRREKHDNVIIRTEGFHEGFEHVFVDMGKVSRNWFTQANLWSSNLSAVGELHRKWIICQ